MRARVHFKDPLDRDDKDDKEEDAPDVVTPQRSASALVPDSITRRVQAAQTGWRSFSRSIASLLEIRAERMRGHRPSRKAALSGRSEFHAWAPLGHF
ncbi:hypothetical protein CBOM_05140 [Ceraceosorus bombacis]|uniref:Uncharacterized protein n=1 Tax=Ceraceosorus bombacis TaxID=401625 RepID=A0A0P1BJ44_9BASI|nr:hypothetical protein CBOM_05140 [Ceraceosorus bombacis]